MRCALTDYRLPNLGRIVYLRSPFQEQLPALAIRKYGRLGAMLIHGKMLSDLASDWVKDLPQIRAESGLVIERGLSALGREFGLNPADFETYQKTVPISTSNMLDVLSTPLSHDDVYSDDELLKQMAFFIESGRFTVDKKV